MERVPAVGGGRLQHALRACSGFIGLLLLTFCISLPISPVIWAEGDELSVSGNHVIQANGQVFIPEGISIYGGLESPDWRVNPANITAQIQAAQLYWHANTVRLQVAQSNLFSGLNKGQRYNSQFLAALYKEVSYARGLGLAVVINDQTEFTTNIPSPTVQTARFWSIIAPRYRTDGGVIFDIFNEPRLTSFSSATSVASPNTLNTLFGPPAYPPDNQISQSVAWNLWKSGGLLNGQSFLGMQQIVNDIRAAGAHNIIWVEGSYGARRLPPTKYLLSGSNLVYAIHHPDLNQPASWRPIASLAAIRPVVEGEWAQYQSKRAECFSDAYRNVPRYLHYLHDHGVGVIAWSLQANSLLKGSSAAPPHDLNSANDPTKATALQAPNVLLRNYSCSDHRIGQGAGLLLQRYFSQTSQPLQG